MSLLERIQWLDTEIRANRYPNPDTMGARFGVSRRTAQSDCAHLRVNLAAPIAFDRSRRGWYYTEKTFALTSLVMTDSQFDTLRRAILAARELLGERDAATLEALIAAAAPLAQPSHPPFESVHGAMRLTYDIGAAAELLEDCRRAILDRCRLHIRYYAAGRDDETVRIVRPYHILNHLGENYLIAWCEERQAIRQFFVGRIREYDILSPEHSYVVDPDFDPDKYPRGFLLRHGEDPVTVRIRFSPYQARWIRERIYHATQTLEEQDDGGLILTVRVAGTIEIRRWVLGYGPDAEVLEPESLRAEIADIAKKISAIYGPGAE